MATTQAEARVQIVVPGHVIDVPMSNYAQIGDSLAELIPFLDQELSRAGKDVSWLNDATAHWTLRRPFRTRPLDAEKTLAEEKVVDGSRLLLVKQDPGEKFPPLIDDVAEAIAYWLKEHFPSWDGRISQRINLILLPCVLAFVCALAAIWAQASQPSFVARLITCGILGAAACVSAAIALVVVRTERDRYGPVVVPFLTITYISASTAALIITPRPFGIYQLTAAGAVLFTLSVSLAVITRTNARLHYGTAVAAAAVTIVATINMAYRSPTAVVGVQLITLSFLFLLQGKRLALALARFSQPYIPATGESYLRAGDLDAGSLPRDGRAAESILNQEEQTVSSYECLVGIITGTVATIAATAWFVGRNLDNHQWVIFVFIFAIALSLLFHGKSYDDAKQQGIVLVSTALLAASFAGGLITSPNFSENHTRAAIAVGILTLATVIAAIYSIQERRIVSPVTTRLLERFEWATYAVILPLLVLAMDGFTKARAR